VNSASISPQHEFSPNLQNVLPSGFSGSTMPPASRTINRPAATSRICSTGAPIAHRSDRRPHGRSSAAGAQRRTPAQDRRMRPDHARYWQICRDRRKAVRWQNRFNHNANGPRRADRLRSSTHRHPFPAKEHLILAGSNTTPATIWPLCSSAMEDAQCGSPCKKVGGAVQRVDDPAPCGVFPLFAAAFSPPAIAGRAASCSLASASVRPEISAR